MESNSLKLCTLAIAFACFASGCSLLKPDRKADAMYEQARRQVEGEYRTAQASFEEPDDGFSWSDLRPSNITREVKDLTGNGPDAQIARQLFAEADVTYRQATGLAGEEKAEMFEDAALKYQAAAVRWPDSALEQDALFMASESLFFADNFRKASDAYTKLIKQYPNTRHLDIVESRRFSIAQYWMQKHREDPQSFFTVNVSDNTRPRRNDRTGALKIFNAIRLDDPTGKLADDATMAAAVTFFEDGKFVKADEYFTDLRDAFPQSEHQFDAHFFGIQAKLKSYWGPDYSSEPLEGAEKLIEKVRKQFPDRARDPKVAEPLARAYAEVRFKKAEREFLNAEFYYGRSEYAAARFHYQEILNDFSEVTPFAAQARERIAEIAGRPGTPPQRLSWLVNLFPSDEPQNGPLISNGTVRR